MQEQNELLQQASNEIKMLRHHNEIMSAKLEMFENVMQILRSVPASGKPIGMSEDVAWKIDTFLTRKNNIINSSPDK